jgi:tripartite ATP-independent transporter DctP family solute receptor
MNKKLLVTLTLATLSISVNATTLKFATGTSQDVVSGKLIQEFADRVRDETSDRVKVKVFWNGSLGSQSQYLQQIQTGIVDMGIANSGTLANIDPAYGILNLPYIFKTTEDYQTVMDSDFMQNEMYQYTEKHGFTSIGYINNGFRSLLSAKPVNNVGDLKNLKIRTQDSRVSIDTLELMGVTPIPLNFGDVYPGLQQGIIEGASMGLSSFWDLKYGEIIKYGIKTEHTRLTDFVVMSNRVEKKVSKEDLVIMKEIMADISNKSINLVEEDQQKSIDLAVEKMNVKIIDVDKDLLISKFDAFYKPYENSPKVGHVYKAIKALTN